MNAEDLLNALAQGYASRANELGELERVCEKDDYSKREELRLRSLAMLDHAEACISARNILR